MVVENYSRPAKTFESSFSEKLFAILASWWASEDKIVRVFKQLNIHQKLIDNLFTIRLHMALKLNPASTGPYKTEKSYNKKDKKWVLRSLHVLKQKF